MPSKITWSKGAWIIAPFFKLWPALAVSLVLLVTPLRAQFVYVTNLRGTSTGGTVSAYSIGPTGTLTPFRVRPS
jgi:hypothetical protein